MDDEFYLGELLFFGCVDDLLFVLVVWLGFLGEVGCGEYMSCGYVGDDWSVVVVEFDIDLVEEVMGVCVGWWVFYFGDCGFVDDGGEW